MPKPPRASIPSDGNVVDWEWFVFDRFTVSATGSDLSTFGELLTRTDQQGKDYKVIWAQDFILYSIQSNRIGSTFEMLSPL